MNNIQPPTIRFSYIDYQSGKNVIHSTEEISLSEVVKDFEYFLKGCGFHFDGELQFFTEYEFEDDESEGQRAYREHQERVEESEASKDVQK